MADLAAQLLTIAFQGLIVATFAILAITFVTFRGMNREVRRARMYILANRFERFLAAITIAFLALTVSLISSTLGVPLPAGVAVAIVFVFLGGILYGTFEIFFVIRPRPRKNHLALRRLMPNRIGVREAPDEASGDAPK